MRVYLSGNPVHDWVLEAFHAGVDCHAELVRGFAWKPADVAVVFGVRKERVPLSWPRGKVIAQQRKAGLPVIILETGYINRGDGENHHYAAGWNGLNGRADFRNHGSRRDRWDFLGVDLAAWRDGGERVVVCGQVPWDASVQHHDHIGWCQSICAKLSRAGHEVAFRPHPFGARVDYGTRVQLSMRPLCDDFEDARCVVTFNSNAAVEAAIAGVPVFAFDEGSMAWPIANKTLDAIDNPARPDRAQWAYDLAYTQWTPAEMARGEAWRHLTR